jgi:hypothetical protein
MTLGEMQGPSYQNLPEHLNKESTPAPMKYIPTGFPAQGAPYRIKTPNA